jgi:translation initiation factor IF-1
MVERIERDRLEFDGVVVDTNSGVFKIKVSENHIVTCTLSGKIRVNSVRILLGDKVTIEVSQYSPDKGRIVYRHKG